MNITLHPHSLERMSERGASKEEIIRTVDEGEQVQAKFNRIGFRSNFKYDKEWNGKFYATKQLEVIAVPENDELIIITIIVKYY